MRLWSLDPRYLDPIGLVALWREGLLAQKVLLGRTVGYKFHPQLTRFKAAPDPVHAIGHYLHIVAAEAARRDYRFDATKIAHPDPCATLRVRRGQLDYEWAHLLEKLRVRSPLLFEQHRALRRPRPHPLFTVSPGGVEEWERRL